MLIAVLLLLIGVAFILMNPILGLIPGGLLIVLAIVWFVFAVLFRGLGAITGRSSRKTCPECRSKIPSKAIVCRYCNYRYRAA